MASENIRDPRADHLLTPQNAALLIIHYQPTQVSSIASRDKRALIANVVALARTANLYGLPVVLSTVNVKTNINKPTIHQITDVLPGVEAIDRTSINAWEDESFVHAVRATERKKLLIAALWTEVCLLFPALDALHEGYEVYPVIAAIVTFSQLFCRGRTVPRLIAGGKAKSSRDFGPSASLPIPWNRDGWCDQSASAAQGSPSR
jgi:nicotinamidase-related amidase